MKNAFILELGKATMLTLGMGSKKHEAFRNGSVFRRSDDTSVLDLGKATKLTLGVKGEYVEPFRPRLWED